jgi:hypothetical protein
MVPIYLALVLVDTQKETRVFRKRTNHTFPYPLNTGLVVLDCIRGKVSGYSTENPATDIEEFYVFVSPIDGQGGSDFETFEGEHPNFFALKEEYVERNIEALTQDDWEEAGTVSDYILPL